MRLYNLKYGKYAGEHKVYESVSEAQADLGKESFPLWTDFDNYAEKDWVRSDDGCVLQILRIYEWKGKTKARITYYLKIAIGGVYLYNRKKTDGSGEYEWAGRRLDVLRMLGQYRSVAMGGKYLDSTYDPVMGKNLTLRKRMFCYYTALYSNPIKAYLMVLPENKRRDTVLTKSKALLLLRDPKILEEIKKYTTMGDFNKRLKQALSSKDIDENRLATELDEGLKKAGKGSLRHLGFVKLMGEILTQIEVEAKAELPNADFQLLPDIENTKLPEPQKAIAQHIPDEIKQEVAEHNTKIDFDNKVNSKLGKLITKIRENNMENVSNSKNPYDDIPPIITEPQSPNSVENSGI